MTQDLQQLLTAFDTAIKNKEDGKFGKDDIKAIFEAASKVFEIEDSLTPQQVEQVRDKWVKLAEGHIDKARATKKLQGTSRAQAIQSVLSSML